MAISDNQIFVQWLLVGNLCVSFALLGLILVVQIVHYPSFHWVPQEKFQDFEKFHSKSITTIVAPLMLLELALAIVLTFYQTGPYPIINLLLTASLWGTTYFISVPYHQKLMEVKDSAVIDKLTKTNWIRTFLWSLKSVLSILLFSKGILNA